MLKSPYNVQFGGFKRLLIDASSKITATKSSSLVKSHDGENLFSLNLEIKGGFYPPSGKGGIKEGD